MWFLVVLMTMTPNDITPMWVLATETFANQTTCTQFAVENQHMLFQKAIEAHEYRIKPTLITCVSAESMETMQMTPKQWANHCKETGCTMSYDQYLQVVQTIVKRFKK